MEKINFFNGMEVENTDFNKLELYFEERINKNQSSLTNAGILINADLPDGTILSEPYLSTSEDNKTLSIYSFVAYDQEGRLLYLAPKYNEGVQIPSLQNLKPASGTSTSLANRKLISTGSTVDFGINIEYYVVARYDEVYTDDLRKQDVTDVLIPATIMPSVSFYLRAAGGIIPNDVILGKLITDSFGKVYVSEEERDSLSIRGDIIASNITQGGEDLGRVTFEQHLNMLGSGDYSSSNPHALAPSDLGIDPAATGKHQQYEHTNGIITSNRESLSSALSYRFETTNINDIIISVQALSSDNNEMAAIADTSLYPSNFNGILTQTLYQNTTTSGFYLLYLNRDANIGLLGPYTSDTDNDFISNLSNETILPICSFYWGEPRFYSLTLGGTLLNSGDSVTGWQVFSTDEFALYNSSDTIKATDIQVGNPEKDTIYYAPQNDYLKVLSITKSIGDDFLSTKSIDTSSVRDRRPFSTLGLNNIKTTDLATIKTSAPFFNENATCYNARVISSKDDTAFILSGLTLSIEFDGSLCSPSLIFPSASFYTAQDVVNRINNWIETAYTGPNTDNKPRALLNQEGKIMLLAAESIIIQDIGSQSAEDVLGFNEQSSDVDGVLKTIISEIGNEVDSMQDFYYDDSGDLLYIKYTLPSGSFKQHTLIYSGDGVILGYKGVI